MKYFESNLSNVLQNSKQAFGVVNIILANTVPSILDHRWTQSEMMNFRKYWFIQVILMIRVQNFYSHELCMNTIYMSRDKHF